MVAGAGNVADWADVAYAVNPPRIRLVANATQATLTNATAVPIVFGSGTEAFDAWAFHDEVTNNTRVTPNVAGLYEVRGAVAFGGRNDYTTLQAYPRTNGTTVYPPGGRPLNPSGATQNITAMVAFGPTFIQFNGTTDYVELIAMQSNTATATGSAVASLQLASVLEMIRKCA